MAHHMHPLVIVRKDNVILVPIRSPASSPYGLALWPMHVELLDTFPFKSPSFGFAAKKGVPYHCNISPEGSICFNVLNESWLPALRISDLLTENMSWFFSSPNQGDPLNVEAAAQFRSDVPAYAKKCRESTEASAFKVAKDDPDARKLWLDLHMAKDGSDEKMKLTVQSQDANAAGDTEILRTALTAAEVCAFLQAEGSSSLTTEQAMEIADITDPSVQLRPLSFFEMEDKSVSAEDVGADKLQSLCKLFGYEMVVPIMSRQEKKDRAERVKKEAAKAAESGGASPSKKRRLDEGAKAGGGGEGGADADADAGLKDGDVHECVVKET